MIRVSQRRGSWVYVAWTIVGVAVGCGGDSDETHDAGRDAGRKDTVGDNRSEPSTDGGRDAAVDTSRPDRIGSIDVESPPIDGRIADIVAEALPKPDPVAVLAAKSAECASCAKARCPLQLAGCGEIVGSATEGPGKGTPKAALCVDTLACVVPSGCAADINKSWACYCDGLSIGPTLCYSAGPCKPVFERSMEATDPAVVVGSFTDTAKGGGWAMTLVQCLYDNRCTSCLAPPPSDAGIVDATVDARADVGSTGGTGGAGGSGGSGTGGTAGKGGSGGVGAGGSSGTGGTGIGGTGGSGGTGTGGAPDAAVDGDARAIDALPDGEDGASSTVDVVDANSDSASDASSDDVTND